MAVRGRFGRCARRSRAADSLRGVGFAIRVWGVLGFGVGRERWSGVRSEGCSWCGEGGDGGGEACGGSLREGSWGEWPRRGWC